MIIQNFILPISYSIFRWQKINNRLVLFVDAHHSNRPKDMDRLYQYLYSMDYKIIELYSDYQKQPAIKTLKDMIIFMKLYARAGFVVICDNFLPVASCNKREETTVIQLWHGGGAFKCFGYDTKNDIPSYYKGNIYKNYNIVTVSSKKCIEYFSSAMNLDKSIFMPIGISRTDDYFSKVYLEQCKHKFNRLQKNAQNKKTILWAPTFRGNADKPYVVGEEAIKNLQKYLGDEWIILIKYHPHVKKETNCFLSTEELLPVIDLLITDYSSIIFDYSIFNKPAVFYAPDLKDYNKKRGFYLDYETLPGPIVQDAEDLETAVRNEYDNFDEDRMKRFYIEYMELCDGNATKRILDIMDNKKSFRRK